MKVFHINWTSWENPHNSSNMICNDSERRNDTDGNSGDYSGFSDWINLITIGIGLPLTLMLIAAVVLQLKKDQGSPVYIINLFISDLLQLCSRIPMILSVDDVIPGFFCIWGILVSVGFMMCISVERYLVIAKAVWYKFRRNRKTYVVVCIVVWVLPLPLLLAIQFNPFMKIYTYILTFIFLLPFPLFIFFLCGTIRALSAAHRVPADEKRRIVAILVVVLLMYTILFLPIIVWFLLQNSLSLQTVASICIYMSPLADTILYLLIRKSLLDKVLASLCFCKMSDGEEMSSMGNDNMTAPSTDTV
ncbi:G-protein coupled receptor 4-like [Poeciliopsis prolifica]|uniref:G-protein coupled receptor 4-like n=1 Tax=Poeciliopsis prolifica TaxID=188132 RepID=UPI002413CE9A|nr:G-protein coupled receptor 4-like [Poeciliopsis prolifica]